MAGIEFPVYVRLGGFAIHPHPLFEILAYVFGYRLFVHSRSRKGDHLVTDDRVVVVIAAAFGALIGSRLLGLLEAKQLWDGTISSTQEYFQYKTVVGGLLGGTLAVEAAKYFRGISSSTGDIFVFPLIVAIAVGRVGCFLSGLEDATYGIATTFWTGIDFGDGISRHPTALYEVFALGVIATSMYFLRETLSATNGLAFKYFLFWYLAFRVAVETIKPTYHPFFNLSMIQMVSFLAALIYGCKIVRASREEPTRAK